jgi:hypothetical protein
MGPNFQIADIQATERLNLDGGQVNFTAYVMPKTDKPEFRLGNLSFFDSIQELFSPKDIRFESHPVFSDYYLLTSEVEEATRKLFTPNVMDFLEKHRNFKIEVNDKFIIIFKEQRILDVNEIDNLLTYSQELLSMFTENLKKV